jgi:hypothetical protein
MSCPHQTIFFPRFLHRSGTKFKLEGQTTFQSIVPKPCVPDRHHNRRMSPERVLLLCHYFINYNADRVAVDEPHIFVQQGLSVQKNDIGKINCTRICPERVAAASVGWHRVDPPFHSEFGGVDINISASNLGSIYLARDETRAENEREEA